jgi:integrase
LRGPEKVSSTNAQMISIAKLQKFVSERLGHASVVLTLDTYSHVLPNMQQTATDEIERMLLAAS